LKVGAQTQGSLYPALWRLEQERCVSFRSGPRRRTANFYSIVAVGRRQLASATDDWPHISRTAEHLPVSERASPVEEGG
jgi:DNA-binding PadR family transcriptional regulator